MIDAKLDEARQSLARNILTKLGGFQVVEALREMKAGGHKVSLVALTDELSRRGLKVSNNSSDLSGVCGWLREAGVLKEWDIVEDAYTAIMGTTPKTIAAFRQR